MPDPQGLPTLEELRQHGKPVIVGGGGGGGQGGPRPPDAQRGDLRSGLERFGEGTFTGYGVTPTAIKQTIRGLIGLAADPSRIPGVLKASVVDPIVQHGPQAALDLAQMIPGVGPAIEGGKQVYRASQGRRPDLWAIARSFVPVPQGTDIAEALPLMGPGYTSGRERMERGDWAGGVGEWVGNTASGPFVGPRFLKAAVTNPARSAVARMGEAVLNTTDNPGVRAAFDKNLMWFGPASGMRRAERQIGQDVGRARTAADATPPTGPMVPGRLGGGAGPAVRAEWDQVTASNKPAVRAQVQGHISDPAFPPATPSGAIQMGENLRADALGSFRPEDFMARAQMDDAWREAGRVSPGAQPHLTRASEFSRGQQVLGAAPVGHRGAAARLQQGGGGGGSLGGALSSAESFFPWLLRRTVGPGLQAASSTTRGLDRAAVVRSFILDKLLAGDEEENQTPLGRAATRSQGR